MIRMMNIASSSKGCRHLLLHRLNSKKKNIPVSLCYGNIGSAGSGSNNFELLRYLTTTITTEDGENISGKKKGNEKDRNRQRQDPQSQTPQWLHSFERQSKTHVNNDLSRGGKVGRWGSGGGRRPAPGHVLKGSQHEDIVAGSRSDSSHPHLKPQDIPRLAARRRKTKAIHDSSEGLSDPQLLGLVSDENDDTTITAAAAGGGFPFYYEEEEEETEETFLEKYKEIASASKAKDFWALEIAEEEEVQKFLDSLHGWSLDDPRLQPDEKGRYNILDDPRDEIDGRNPRQQDDQYDAFSSTPVNPEEAYFYRDILNFSAYPTSFPDPEEMNKVLPIARHGPNLDDFLEAMLEHPTKYAMASRTNLHPESYREPRPLRSPHRRDPTVDFVANRHKAFLFAQGIDASVTLSGGGGHNDALYADFSNVDQRHKVAEKFANIFKVDVRSVSPANFTSAFIGFESLKAAKIALVKYQGKELTHQHTSAARFNADELDLTRLSTFKSTQVGKFLENANHESLIVISNLPPRRLASESLLHQLFSGSPISLEDILVFTPTTALVRLPSPEAVTSLLKSPAFAAKLKTVKPRAKLTILKAVRERVFDKYDGVNKWKLVKKKGHRLLVEGDVPSDEFFRSHYNVVHLSNLSPNITKKDITDFFQKYSLRLRDILSSVELIHASDGTFMRAAFVGFDGLGEAERALADWTACDKSLLGGDLVEMHPVGEKKLSRGTRMQPRSERSPKELQDDLINWERFVDPKKLEFLEAYGISKESLDDVFIKVRFQNRSFGPIDQARVSERLEPDRPAGSRYAEFVRLYVDYLFECMTTPDNPGPVVASMFFPGEKVDLEAFDGKRKWPSPPKIN
jgi:hypothetical protein